MKSWFLYISLLVFLTSLAAPSLVVWADLSVKETKVAKLFDLEEEEDTRDSDSEKETEKEKENNPEEKFFTALCAALDSSFFDTNNLIHYSPIHFYVLDEFSEQLTPPPWCGGQ